MQGIRTCRRSGAKLAAWYWSLGSVSVKSITSRQAEVFYWATIMFSQTLGTALGDWMADPKTGFGLGYEGGALVFGAHSHWLPPPIAGPRSRGHSCSGPRSF